MNFHPSFHPSFIRQRKVFLSFHPSSSVFHPSPEGLAVFSSVFIRLSSVTGFKTFTFCNPARRSRARRVGARSQGHFMRALDHGTFLWKFQRNPLESSSSGILLENSRGFSTDYFQDKILPRDRYACAPGDPNRARARRAAASSQAHFVRTLGHGTFLWNSSGIACPPSENWFP